ncbi:MAG: DUF2330 domain-containing protein [Myxococcota bacterium]
MHRSVRPRAVVRALGIALALALVPAGAAAICRVVEPLSGSAVRFDEETAVLVVEAPDQLVDHDCADGSRPEEVPPPADTPWAGSSWVCADGTSAAPVLGGLVHAVVQPRILGGGGHAGLIMPVPARADVNLAPPELLRTARELVVAEVTETLEFVEDASLGFQCSDPHYSANEPPAALAAPLALYGCGDSGDFYRPGLSSFDASVVEYEDGGTVAFEEIALSDAYEVTVLSASDLEALTRWLDDNGFAHDASDDAAFERYLGEDHWFVALNVAPPADAEAAPLAPLVVSWPADRFVMTHELSFDGDMGGVIETDVLVLAPGRRAPVDGFARTLGALPFALEEGSPLEAFGLLEGWVTHLHFERRLADASRVDAALVPGPNDLLRPQETRATRVRIARACCEGNAIPGGEGRSFTETRTYLANAPPPDDSLFYQAPAPDPENCSRAARDAWAEDAGWTTPEGVACSVAGATASWAPVLLAFGLGLRRRRRR